MARLRAEAADKTKHSASERIALLEQAGEQERLIAERSVQAAKMQYEIIKSRNALTQSNAEDLKKEAEAYAAVVGAETSYYNKVREINAGITEARNAEAKAASDAAKAAKDAAAAKIATHIINLDDLASAPNRSQGANAETQAWAPQVLGSRIL